MYQLTFYILASITFKMSPLAEIHQPATCPGDEFKCKSPTSEYWCIARGWVCDGENDCGDNSDEEECADIACGPHEFSCNSSSRCLWQSLLCDGIVDCIDRSDELNCPSSSSTLTCTENEFTCSNLECIGKSWECDGFYDCEDESDEADCEGHTCQPDQFQCDYHHCIPAVHRCDGNPDCPDESDEENCGTVARAGCKEHTEFDCHKDGKTCIPMENVCDGKNDCGDYADEPAGADSFCNATNDSNACDINNGGCSQICSLDIVDVYCSCHPGYEMDIDGKSCFDINECEIRGSCSHYCENVEGSFKCSCKEGYTFDSKGHYCKVSSGEPVILFSNRKDLREIKLYSREYRAVVKRTRAAVSLDYDYTDGFIYWSDVALEQILRAPYHNQSTPDEENVEVIVDEKITSPDGIAVDWIHKNLYWIDTAHKMISVVHIRNNSTKSCRKTLFSTDMDEPRAIAVDPRDDQGWIYWSDWGTKAKIEKAGMNGYHRSAIVTNGIVWPSGLTIDYVMDKLYWVDGKLHTIMTSDLDGNHVTVVLTSLTYLHHPFSISVFEDTLYWTDMHSIHKTNKFNGSEVEDIADSLFSPMDIQILHELKQPMSVSACGDDNGGCSHLCLAAPRISLSSAKYTCACPDDMALHGDGLKCLSTIIPETIAMNVSEVYSSNQSTFGNVVGNVTSTPASDDPHGGSIKPIVVGGIVGIIIFIFIGGLLVYRCCYMGRSIKIMYFDDPIYKRITEDQFTLVEKKQYQPSRILNILGSLPGSLMTAGQQQVV